MEMKLLGVICIFSTLIFQSCQTDQSEMEQIVKIMGKEDPDAYERVLTEFLGHARNKNVDSMLDMTSLVTIKSLGGREAVKRDYTEDKVPALCKYSTDLSGSENIYLPPKDGTVGWAFRKSLRSPDGEVKRFQFIVLKEGGRYVVSALSPLKG